MFSTGLAIFKWIWMKCDVNEWPLPSQSWSCPSWRRYWPSPTSCLRRPRWWKTPRWGGRRGPSRTCAASIWTRRSAPLPRRRMRKWFRGSNKWPAPRRQDTRVQNTITCPEASLCTASPNCCSSSVLCTQLIPAHTHTQVHSHSCRDACICGYEDANNNIKHMLISHMLKQRLFSESLFSSNCSSRLCGVFFVWFTIKHFFCYLINTSLSVSGV